VFYDVGANVGYYTLLGSRAVGPEGKVLAFEPLPRNLSYLHRHLALNGITNVDVVQAALLDHEGNVAFESEGGPSQARVSWDGSRTVAASTLDSLAIPPPNVVKMDVEGAEIKVLEGGIEMLREHRPFLIFSTHGSELRRECYHLLDSIGYDVRPLDVRASDHVAQPG
jgi:FkbM family methyltransferase